MSSSPEMLSLLLLEQLTEGVVITDENGEMVLINHAAEVIRNIEREKLIGHNVIDCHNKKSQENVARAIHHLKNNPRSNFQRIINDQKNNKIFENTYTSICDKGDNFQGIAVITRDITEKRQSEELKLNYSHSQELAIENLKAQYNNLMIASMETLINVLEARDHYTNGHSKRVSEISLKLYNHVFGLDEYYINLQNASKLHDIGKVCIPDYLIQKPDKLSDAEFEVVKNHSSIAADIIKPIDPEQHLSLIIRHHHERYDGTGYPDHLVGERIPLGSRIISIADSFDAMSSDRPYRKALPYEICIEEIGKNAGRQFDPFWVSAFLELAGTGSI